MSLVAPFFMFSRWKCWLLTFAVILTLLVCAYLVFLLPSLYCPYMLMIRPLFHALIVPLERSSPFMLDSNKALVPSSILVNVKVFGWVRGVHWAK